MTSASARRAQGTTANGKRAKFKPKNWPQNIDYIRIQEYGASISKEILAFLKCTHNGSRVSFPFAEPWKTTQIRIIDDPSHPACGQRGLFAIQKIPSHSHILDYLGEVHSDNREESDYDLSLHRSHDGNYNIGVRFHELYVHMHTNF